MKMSQKNNTTLTPLIVYLYSGDEPEKRAAALALIEQNNSIVSTQVLSAN